MINLSFHCRVRKLNDSVTPSIRRLSYAFGANGRRQVLSQVGNEMVSMGKSTFGLNSTYRGNTWSRYSPAYARRVGSSIPTLYRTGKLKNSIKRDNPQVNTITVSANTPYAAAQFYGSSNGIPSRRFMPLTGVGNTMRLTLRADREITMLIGREFMRMVGGR